MGIMWWSDIERLSIIMTLHDIGFTNENIEKYMRLLADGSGTQKQRMGMLNKKRNGTIRLFKIWNSKRKSKNGWLICEKCRKIFSLISNTINDVRNNGE